MRRVLSYGGGLDSFAMLVGSMQRRDVPDVVAFVDVADPEHQDPGEWDSTYRHIEEVVRPLCAHLGVEFVAIDSAAYPVRNARSLFAWLKERRQIPMSGPNRICTVVAKVERFERWMDDRFPGEDVEVWVGFEAGEEKRAAKDPNAGKKRKPKAGAARRVNRFPLIEWGLCRCACEELVQRAGFPIPRKSACVFCPYGTKGDWQTLAEDNPLVFEKVVELERDKPPTKERGLKLTIMAYDSKKKRGVPLDQWVKTPYRAQRDLKPCTVCGRAVRATKACGTDYLPPPSAPAQTALTLD